MGLKSGTIDDFDDSMAKEMEKAFFDNWPLIMKNTELPKSNDQMKLLFIAISKGVVNHLIDNANSFKVVTTVDGSSTRTRGNVSEITLKPNP